MTIFIGADHNGWQLKEKIKLALQKQRHKVSDQGNLSFQATDDYPDFAKKVALMIKKNKNSVGILLCGSGQGMCMAINRFAHIRAVVAHSKSAIKAARQDEDVNVICLPAKELNLKKSQELIKVFFETPFSKLPRHQKRIKKLSSLK
ncbi:RpiB/LacA/LacB family sugar-phosphate isomerase [Candidatus Nomurabacteria bacterium]|nr:RpiB/LacA/LacB family sugar-phosphate isomerase [Candidatus Nomurabacteria bacterium]